MAILLSLLIVLEVLVSLLLIGVVLLQKSREQGLGMAFGASVGESLFGSRAGNVLTKATIVLGSVFAANTLLIGLIYAGRAAAVTEGLADRVSTAEQTQTLEEAPGGEMPATDAGTPGEAPVEPPAPSETPAAGAPAPEPAAAPVEPPAPADAPRPNETPAAP